MYQHTYRDSARTAEITVTVVSFHLQTDTNTHKHHMQCAKHTAIIQPWKYQKVVTPQITVKVVGFDSQTLTHVIYNVPKTHADIIQAYMSQKLGLNTFCCITWNGPGLHLDS